MLQCSAHDALQSIVVAVITINKHIITITLITLIILIIAPPPPPQHHPHHYHHRVIIRSSSKRLQATHMHARQSGQHPRCVSRLTHQIEPFPPRHTTVWVWGKLDPGPAPASPGSSHTQQHRPHTATNACQKPLCASHSNTAACAQFKLKPSGSHQLLTGACKVSGAAPGHVPADPCSTPPAAAPSPAACAQPPAAAAGCAPCFATPAWQG